MLPTHYDLAVILAVSFAIQLGVLGFVAWLAWSGPREGQRLTRVVGALILQEADKIRAMVRDARPS